MEKVGYQNERTQEKIGNETWFSTSFPLVKIFILFIHLCKGSQESLESVGMEGISRDTEAARKDQL